jgi:hypothetical protein
MFSASITKSARGGSAIDEPTTLRLLQSITHAKSSNPSQVRR